MSKDKDNGDGTWINYSPCKCGGVIISHYMIHKDGRRDGLMCWCDSYGEELPWLTEAESKAGLTYESKYPKACGLMRMGG